MKEILKAIVLALQSLLKKLKEKTAEQLPTKNEPGEERATTFSSECLDIIKYYEKFMPNAYKDAVGVVTIGYGDTGSHVKLGQKISLEEAEARLVKRLEQEFVPGVLKALTRPATQCQLDAMISLAYNIGVGAFQKSTLVKKFNAGDTLGAAAQFSRWTFAGGKSLKGLRRRRKTEEERFLGASAADAIRIGAQVD